MKAHKKEHLITGDSRTIMTLVYDVKEFVRYEYPKWKIKNRSIAGLSKESLEGCVTNSFRYTREPYSDTYPY